MRTSKYLCWVLRHAPAAAGVAMDAEGWVPIDDILAAAQRAGRTITRAVLDDVVRTDDKHRLVLSSDGHKIRAAYGHSVDVELGLTSQRPPATLYHGTVDNAVATIMSEGIQPRSRQYVHLSADIHTATRVGARRGNPHILVVDAAGMYESGIVFLMPADAVWLVSSVPPQFITGRANTM